MSLGHNKPVECPLCNTETSAKPYSDQDYMLLECKTCGNFNSNVGIGIPNSAKNKHLLSGITREASDRGILLTVLPNTIENLLQSASIPASPLEAMDRILLYLERNAPSADEYVNLAPDTNYPISFAKHQGEFSYYVSNLRALSYIESHSTMGRAYDHRLTASGWERVIEVRRTERDSDQAFVAMWFDSSLDSAFDNGFKLALEETGYRPVRIDREQYNEKIDDRIIAEIRRSGLVVADFTGNRQGVYFEAGFAMGLGIPVIWTCKQDDIGSVHFDTRQYNHIIWTEAEGLKEKLINRIEATIPGRARRSESN